MAKELSGPDWVARFPDLGAMAAMTEPFRSGCEAFVAALRSGGAIVAISSTVRPKERAYLMNGAWRIGKKLISADTQKSMPGVEIEWVHRKPNGAPDFGASIAAARAMIAAYDLAHYAALKSNHTLGLAIDMTIGWTGALAIIDAKGEVVTIASSPKTGMNHDVWKVGRSYGVIKHKTDQPHWSIDGR